MYHQEPMVYRVLRYALLVGSICGLGYQLNLLYQGYIGHDSLISVISYEENVRLYPPCISFCANVEALLPRSFITERLREQVDQPDGTVESRSQIKTCLSLMRLIEDKKIDTLNSLVSALRTDPNSDLAGYNASSIQPVIESCSSPASSTSNSIITKYVIFNLTLAEYLEAVDFNAPFINISVQLHNKTGSYTKAKFTNTDFNVSHD